MHSFILAPVMLSIVTLIAPAAAARPGVGVSGPSSCPDNPTAHLARSGKGVFHKLDKLPPAETYAAVFRRGADGCMVPVRYRDRDAPPSGATRRR